MGYMVQEIATPYGLAMTAGDGDSQKRLDRVVKPLIVVTLLCKVYIWATLLIDRTMG